MSTVTHSRSRNDLDTEDPEETPEEDPEDDDDASDDGNQETKQLLLSRQMKRLENSLRHQLSVAFSYSNLKAVMKWLLDEATLRLALNFEDMTLLMTLYILFADDIKLLTLPRQVDLQFSTSYAVCFFTFIFEFLASSWSKTDFTEGYPSPKWTGYFFSFFWFLDLIAILSLFPDINFIAGPLGFGNLVSSSTNNGNYSKAGRVVRLVRLVRLVRIYKVASERRKRAKEDQALQQLALIGAVNMDDIVKQRKLTSERKSRLGFQLSESTTRRVIIMILTLLIVLPLLIYSPDDKGPDLAVFLLQAFNHADDVSPESKKLALDVFVSSLESAYNNRYIEKLSVSPLLEVVYPEKSNPYVYYRSHLDALRSSAQLTYEVGAESYTDAIFSTQTFQRSQATFSIITTIFVAVMLIGGAVVFTDDAQRLVIDPIERMMNIVEAVAEDPLKEFHFDTSDSDTYETQLLEKTIEKITGLLRVGFGEAGAGIISTNLSAKDASSNINPLLPGVRVYAIFGFCDIHHFEDINQRLTNDVLVFVNTVADIVHSNVHTWSGQCNKNLGNAFVIVWRIGDEQTLSDNAEAARGGKLTLSKKASITVDLKRVPGVDTLADHALIAYLKIIADINRNPKVLSYRTEPRLQDPDHPFKVRMGFGLHAGWAIEGAVGSLQKVDATYLSPHVNMAARLETSSKQYGVPLLASQDFYDLLSPDGKARCRKLDVVTVKGSEVPIGIYTYDAVQDQNFRQRTSAVKSRKSDPSNDTKSAGQGSPLEGGVEELGPNTQFMTPKFSTADVFENDYDLLTLRKHLQPQFLESFNEGINHYLEGDWVTARKYLERADVLMAEAAPSLGGDGPSKTILSYMGNQGFMAPSSWKGYRPLTSK